MTDRPNVERLLNEWWQEYTEHDVRTRALVDAIEADRAAGLLRVPEAIAGQDVRGWHQAAHSLHAEVERLRAEAERLRETCARERRAKDEAAKDRAALRAEVQRLEQWKTDANEVLGAWTSVWAALGQPGQLGDSIAAESLAEVERLREMHDNAAVRFEAQRHLTDLAEEHAERAEAKLAEVRALADELMAFDCVDDLVPSNVDVPDDFEHGIHDAAHRLRAVLDEGGDQ